MSPSEPLDRRGALRLGGGLLLGGMLGCATHGRSSPVGSLSDGDYADHDGLGLADLVRRRQVSADELLDLALARADAVDPKLNAIVLDLRERARAEIARGVPRGPFHGVPFLVKDIGFHMKGVGSSLGSRLWKEHVAGADSTVVERYRQAGLVIFGRTATPEFGLLPTTESSLFGPTRNPWNLERTAGGSSGGAAAAVAAGIVPMASGSDGGGSLRIPASCCGLFGLKPTRARVPLGPDLFEAWNGIVVAHAVTRSVRDSAALLDVSAGPAAGDAYVAPPPRRPYLEEVGAPPGRLRIALSTSGDSGTRIDPQCIAAVEGAASLCESLGHRLEPAEPQLPYPDLHRAMRISLAVSVASLVGLRLARLQRGLREDDLEPGTRALLEESRSISGTDLAWARATFHQSSRRMAAFLRDHDLILSPTLGSPPIEHGVVDLSATDIDAGLAALDAFMPFTRLANWTGQPAMSVPLHWCSDGLPVGVMFAARFGDEATLLRLAAQLEEARPWAGRRPLL